VAVVLAAVAEARIEKGSAAGIGPALYVSGMVLFAFGAFPLRARPAEEAPETRAAPGRLATLFLAALALAAVFPSFLLLQRLGARPGWSEIALWLASLVLVMAAGLAGSRATAFPARWETVLPRSSAGRAAFAVAAIALLVVAAAARVWALGRIPAGINADEGDRAAVGIWMLRGDYPGLPFGSGWYHVSNIYFWILAQTMDVFGISIAGARMLGALCGLLTVGLVLLLGLRHFGWRIALMAEGVAALCGVALQFSRETTEATPTATLWTLAALFFLEAARAGPAWAWIGAGLAGGLSFYFYSPARLWPVLAAFFCIALFLQGRRAIRGRLAAGTAVAAFATVLAMAPFFLDSYRRGTFAIRARETSVFVAQNRLRLAYMRKEWGLPRVLAAQLNQSFGIFGHIPDANYFWPSGRPILPGALSVLTLLGLGAAALRVRDPRMVLLTVWFCVGFVGMVVTVETPALQRMAGAVPVLALFPALVLDDLVRRISSVPPPKAAAARRALTGAATAASFAAIVFLMWKEAVFYFDDYGPRAEPWSFPNGEGRTVAEQGTDSWVFTLGPHFHKISQGWVRFLAPNTPKAGLRFPGSDLPLAIPANRNLVFLVYPNQSDYLPWLQGLYPGGVLLPVKGSGENVWFTIYRIPKERWQATQGALAIYPDGRAVHVHQLGETSQASGGHHPARWTAALRVGRTGNYAFRLGPGPATLEVDGSRVVRLAAGQTEGLATATLLRGDHAVTFEAGRGAHLEWAALASTLESTPPSGWSPPATALLRPLATPPGGLLGVVTSPGGSEQRRLDGTIATANLTEQLAASQPLDAVWSGTITIRTAGVHRFAFRTAGADVDLSLDGVRAWREGESPEVLIWREMTLAAGPHAVRISVHVPQGPGQVEWIWTPPGGTPSIVPASVLAPAAGSGVGPETPADAVERGGRQPQDRAFTPQR
jgi:4-amino-4-deoxy-L-arabinose transferase-like glycosyltransferase